MACEHATLLDMPRDYPTPAENSTRYVVDPRNTIDIVFAIALACAAYFQYFGGGIRLYRTHNWNKGVIAMTCTKVLIAAAVLMCSGTAFSADILVPQDAPSIQAAIDLAQNGDRVLIAAGTYQESIDTLGKSITIEGVDGAGQTVIDGGGNIPGYVVTVDSGSPVLRGLTITGGFGQPGTGPGGGVLINAASPTLEDCVVIDNAGILGGGAAVFGGSPVFRNTIFQDNHALQGGGMYIELGDLTVENSEFIDNGAINFGGAIAILWLTDATITDTLFTQNTVINAGFGGAVYANYATLDFARLDFIENGTAVPGNDGVTWIVSTGGGGGLYTTSTSGRVEASRFLRNVAAFGTGVYVAGQGTLEFVNTLIAENAAHCQCGTGAFYANSSSPVLINSTIAANGGFAGIFTTFNSFPEVTNTIIAGLEDSPHPQSPTAGNGVTTLNFSLVQGNPFAANLGEGNIIVEDWPSLDVNANYAPPVDSPAIDAGNNDALPAGIVTDLLGKHRFVDVLGGGVIVDIGAIELQRPRVTGNGGLHFQGNLRNDRVIDAAVIRR